MSTSRIAHTRHNKFMFMQMARNAMLLSLYEPIVQTKSFYCCGFRFSLYAYLYLSLSLSIILLLLISFSLRCWSLKRYKSLPFICEMNRTLNNNTHSRFIDNLLEYFVVHGVPIYLFIHLFVLIHLDFVVVVVILFTGI